MNVHPTDFTVTVSGANGEANTKTVLGNAAGTIHGLLMLVGVKPPQAAAVYDLAIYDSAGYLLYAENDMTGETATVSMEKLCNSPLRLVLSNCSLDGSYAVRLYAKN